MRGHYGVGPLRRGHLRRERAQDAKFCGVLACKHARSPKEGDGGQRWQFGQKYDDRFMNFTRRIGVPQRRHG